MPEWKAEIRRRLLPLSLEAAREAEIVDELAQHLDDWHREQLAAGRTPEESARLTLEELDGSERLARELLRVEPPAEPRPIAPGAARSGSLVADLLQDLRYAARMLRKDPGFASIAVLTLVLGIGANTALFSVIHTVLLRPLPFREPERLVQLWEARPQRGWLQSSFSDANFWDVRDLNRTLEDAAAVRSRSLNLTGFEHPERLRGRLVTAGFFSTLGVQPVAGRSFLRDEDAPGRDGLIALLSHAFWVRRFGADPAVIGRPLSLDGASYTVVGVLPPGEPWLNEADVFLPLLRRADAQRGSFELAVIGRLKPGVSLEAAQADLARVARELAERYPDVDKGMGVTIVSARSWVASDALRRSLWILMGAVGFMLLIACVNLMNLLLAKATVRAREQALRVALGASRWRIVRQMLAESLLLSALGAGLGIALATGLIALLRAWSPGGIPRLAEVGIDPLVLGFTTLVAIVTALLTGLAPALQASHAQLLQALREGERGVTGERRMGRLRSVLVGAEVALSLSVLVGAGLLLRSFEQLLQVDRGFETDGRLLVEVSLPPGYDNARLTQFLQQFLARVQALPPVVSAAAVSGRPLGAGSTGLGFAAADRPGPASAEVPWASWRFVTSDYFRTMGVPLLKGRTFDEGDRVGQPWRVVISKRLAEQLWPGQDPIGLRMILWKGQGDRPAEVIGVAGDMRERGLALDPTLAVYFPYYGAGSSPVQFVIHTQAAPATLVPALRAALRELDASLPLSNVRSLDEMVSASLASRRFTMLLLAAFAVVALLLALAGVYGVLSYAVSRRTNEIGVRMALGASRGDVLRLIVGQGMRPVVQGAALGVAASLLLSRLMTSMLFGVAASDPVTYAAVALMLVAAAALACYLPALRALRVDATSALRQE